jgi:hypothetical protein
VTGRAFGEFIGERDEIIAARTKTMQQHKREWRTRTPALDDMKPAPAGMRYALGLRGLRFDGLA